MEVEKDSSWHFYHLNYRTKTRWCQSQIIRQLGVDTVDGNYTALKVEIDNIKEDIKEIKADQKETKQHLLETITVLKENQIQQTEILKNYEKQFTQVNSEISDIKNDIDDKFRNQTKWYQNFVDNHFGLTFKILIVAVLLLAGVKLAGFNFESLLGLTK